MDGCLDINRILVPTTSSQRPRSVLTYLPTYLQDRTELGSLEDEEVEIDIDKLNTSTLRELQRFVASCMAQNGPGKVGR